MGIEIDITSANKMIEDIQSSLQDTEKVVVEVAEKLTEYSKEEVPVDTGNLRDAIQYQLDDKYSATIGHDRSKTTKDGNDYGYLVHEGSRAGNGRAPNPFYERAVSRMGSQGLDEIVVKLLKLSK